MNLARLLLSNPKPLLRRVPGGTNPILHALIHTRYAKTGSMGRKELLRRLQSVVG